MRTIRRSAIAAILVFAATVSMALAQGPLQKRVNYTINVPYALRMGDYLLQPGKYVLYQISQNDLNLFALYRNDMTHSPIAMIRTTRIEYNGADYPEKTRIMLDIDESSSDVHPVLRGWNIPGMDGWEIIGVVSKDNHILTRVKTHSR
ncbi:MAG TPA: hypothetical protein VNN73_23610 [Blastocatellia bacterium]|jgi:hypothetical protein|nr:hypothetical protein [Blastocatellia bacterium]